MKIYGDLSFESVGSLVQSGIAIESPDSLPTSGVLPGRLSFVSQKLYICVSVTNNIPTWVELTDEVGADVYTQATAAITWVINHGLNSTTPAVQVYDSSGLQMIPEAVTVNNANTVTISFTTAQAGSAVIVAQSTSGGGGGGGGGGSSSISSLTSATATNTTNNGNYGQVWNWALTSPSSIGFTLSESSAATSGAGSQYIFDIVTRSGSTANPFGVSAGGNNSLTISSTGAFLLGNTLLSGTSGQVLTSNGSTMAPSWVTPNVGPFPIEKQTAATNGQTVFNTSIVSTIADANNETSLEVFVNGIFQEQGSAYTVTGANQVTFSYGLSINSNVVFILFI